MTEADGLAIGVGEVDVTDFGTGGADGVGEIDFLDIHVEEVGEKHGVLEVVLVEIVGRRSEVIELVGLVAVERFVDEGDLVATSAFVGGLEGFGEPAPRLLLRNIAAPFALHGTENGGSAELSAEVDHGEDELESCGAFGSVRIGEGEAVLDHSGAGANGGDSEVVFGGHGFDGLDIKEVGAGQKKFHGVESEAGGLGKAVGEVLMKNERAGFGLGNLRECDGGFHGISRKLSSDDGSGEVGVSGVSVKGFPFQEVVLVISDDKLYGRLRNWCSLDRFMKRKSLVLFLSGWLGFTVLSASADSRVDPATAKEFREQIEPLLQDYCYECHGEGVKKGDISMDKFKDLSAHFGNHELWLRVWQNARTQLMPPEEADLKPKLAERKKLTDWIERRIFKLDPKNPDPGRVTIRRMNREEYRNTIEDLVGVRFNVDDNFPPDDTGFGFDTIGDVLTLSPLLLEKYLSAAEEIAEQALPPGAGKPRPIQIDPGNFRERGNNQQSSRFMEADTEHTVGADRRFADDAKYALEVEYEMRSEGGRPQGQTATWRILIDGKELHRREVTSEGSDRGKFKMDIELSKGEHRFEFSIVPGKPGEGNGTAGMGVNSYKLTRHESSNWDLYPESYRRVFFKGLPPEGAKEQAVYMREIVERFATRAFRRPAEKGTVDVLTKLALAKAKDEKGKFVEGVKFAVTATLTSPRFLFRSEVQAEPDNPGKVVPVDEYALASRLSYFLWSSGPDEELFKLAQGGGLRKNLRAQVDRMLGDEKSERMVANFVGQWLQARDLSGLSIDVRRILRERNKRDAERVFNNGIRRDMRRETELFFQHVLMENRPVLELLNAKYSFLNDNLARFYGIPNVNGRDFRKVDLADEGKGRGGILGQGTFLIVTSQPTRTSPVKRGLFVLDNILGTPAPPPPADVPELEEAKKAVENGTMRELMAAHRQKALCNSCHARMDPIGLALENFNAIGQWRDQEDGREIDSAGQLITGEKFSNVMELKEILASSRKQDFYRCLTEKLLTYALGRGVEYYDAPTVDSIVARMNKNGEGMRELVYGIVESAPFQKRRGDGNRLGRD